MTPENFCYWLQGKLELDGETQPMTVEQVEIMKNHLKMVFVHAIDPSFPASQQEALDEAHNGTGTSAAASAVVAAPHQQWQVNPIRIPSHPYDGRRPRC